MESDVLSDELDDLESVEAASLIITSNSRPLSESKASNFDSYQRRLEPLVVLEEHLIQLFHSIAEAEIPSTTRSSIEYCPDNTTTDTRSLPKITIPEQPSRERSSPHSDTGEKGKEVTVHTSRNWKKTFSMAFVNRSKSPKSEHSGEVEGWWEDPDDPVHVINACAPIMLELWHDPAVRQRLREEGVFLEDTSGL